MPVKTCQNNSPQTVGIKSVSLWLQVLYQRVHTFCCYTGLMCAKRFKTFKKMIIYWPSGDVCLFLEQCQINPCFVWFFCPLKTSFTSCPTPLLNVTAKCSWRRQGNAYGEKQVDQGQNSLICYYHIDFSSSFFISLCCSLLLHSPASLRLRDSSGVLWTLPLSGQLWDLRAESF